MLPRTTALLLVDAQRGQWDPGFGPLHPVDVPERLGRLLWAFRAAGRPVIHLAHQAIEGPGHAFLPETAPLPGEEVLAHRDPDPFQGTALEARLRSLGTDRLVLAGAPVHLALSCAARRAHALGFRILVAGDACPAHDLEDPGGTVVGAGLLHQVALAELHGTFATVVDTEALLALL